MRSILLSLACLAGTIAVAQNTISITHAAYTAMKQNGTLDVTKNYQFTDAVAPTGPLVRYQGSSQRTPSPICSCMIPLDTTFFYVPFVSYSGGSTTVYGPEGRNDDASSTLINLPFVFNFYGVNYNSLYINNNGNISFNNYYSQFTANPFPDPSYNMIAPFWADIDTRNPGGFLPNDTSGVVYFKLTPTAMIVKWDRVGYFDAHTDKQVTFQLIITDGTDPLLPPGKNVGFCYGDMQWTTGDVTGAGGFGSPATVGVNQGNGVDYFQVGTFNQPTPVFDGPYNAPDGVYWLNNQGMYFDVATTGNIPPVIINNNICDTIDVYTGDTLRIGNNDSVQFVIGVSTPEINQNVSATLSCNESLAFSYTLTKNTPTYKEYLCTFRATDLPLGLYYIDIVATDDGVPVKSSTTQVVIRSMWDPGITTGVHTNENVAFNIFPNPAHDQFTVKHSHLRNDVTLKVSNIIGKTIKTIKLSGNEQTVDVSELSAGIYFITIADQNETKTVKLIKK
jgi:hypothetical protein